MAQPQITTSEPVLRRVRAEALASIARPWPLTQPSLPIDAVGRTHQVDNLIQTNWDTTRCSAASAVAMSALAGKPYLNELAAYATRTLQKRLDAVWGLVEDLSGSDPAKRDTARRTLLPELLRHMHAFRLSFTTAAAELHYKPAAPGVGVGVPSRAAESALLVGDPAVAITTPRSTSSELHIAPAGESDKSWHWFVRDGVDVTRVSVPTMTATVPWSRVTDDGHVALQSLDVALAGAAQMLAFYQLTGDELELVERMISCLGAEIAKATAVCDGLTHTKGNPDPKLMQQLADTILVAQQHSAVGLNAAETGQALAASGLHVESTGRAIAWSDLARNVAPGESLLLEGRGHAITFGRLPTGQTFVYDSEGILGDRSGTCIAVARPGDNAERDAYYAPFRATHRVRPAKVHVVQARLAL